MSTYPNLYGVLSRRAAAMTAAGGSSHGALQGGAVIIPTASSSKSSSSTSLVLAFVLGAVIIAAAAVIIIPLVLRSSSNSNSNSSHNINARSNTHYIQPAPAPAPASISVPVPAPALAPVLASAPASVSVVAPVQQTYTLYNVPFEDDAGPLTFARPLHPPPPPHWDPVERQPTAQPRDEPRWPPGRYPAEYGFYGYGNYGTGGYGPDGVWYRPGQLAGILPNAFSEYDYPTNNIMRRPTDPVGPWERAGALVGSDGAHVLPLFTRERGRSSWGKYNYRTVIDKVPLEFGGTRSEWLNSGDWTSITGIPGSFSVQLYEEYR